MAKKKLSKYDLEKNPELVALGYRFGQFADIEKEVARYRSDQAKGVDENNGNLVMGVQDSQVFDDRREIVETDAPTSHDGQYKFRVNVVYRGQILKKGDVLEETHKNFDLLKKFC